MHRSMEMGDIYGWRREKRDLGNASDDMPEEHASSVEPEWCILPLIIIVST